MTGKRYSAEFKAKVALEAIQGELTVSQPVAKHGVHQTLINAWKKQAIEGMAGVFFPARRRLLRPAIRVRGVRMADRPAKAEPPHRPFGQPSPQRGKG